MALQQQVQRCCYAKAAEKDEENQIHGLSISPVAGPKVIVEHLVFQLYLRCSGVPFGTVLFSLSRPRTTFRRLVQIWPPQQNYGCPILRALCEGWDTTAFDLRIFEPDKTFVEI